MKPLAARACARPLTAPSTMALLEQPNHARCAIQLPDPPFSTERARSRSSAGYRPATLPLDSLVGSLAARPIASLGLPWRASVGTLSHSRSGGGSGMAEGAVDFASSCSASHSMEPRAHTVLIGDGLRHCSAVVRYLVRLRTELTRGTARRRAHRLSGAVQCRSEGEYPLVGIRRDRLRMARDELVTLLDER